MRAVQCRHAECRCCSLNRGTAVPRSGVHAYEKRALDCSDLAKSPTTIPSHTYKKKRCTINGEQERGTKHEEKKRRKGNTKNPTHERKHPSRKKKKHNKVTACGRESFFLLHPPCFSLHAKKKDNTSRAERRRRPRQPKYKHKTGSA